MSYVRWSSPGHPHAYDSEVYIYDDVDGGTTCCGCSLSEDGFSWRCDDDQDGPHPKMIAHVRAHIAAGHRVPEFVIPRLQKAKGFN